MAVATKEAAELIQSTEREVDSSPAYSGEKSDRSVRRWGTAFGAARRLDKPAILSRPKVSVIVPLYNQGKFVGECLGSLQAQTMADWEAWVVDDGSTDEGLEEARAYAKRDPRIRVLLQTHEGVSAARNRGLDQATGSFIQFLDADDVLMPEKLERQLRQLEDAPAGSMSVCQFCFRAAEPSERPQSEHRSPGLNRNTSLLDFIAGWESGISAPPHVFLFSAEHFRSGGLRFDSRLPNHVDFECWVRLLHKKPTLFLLEECLVVYRMHQQNMTRNQERMRQGFLKAVEILLQNPELPPRAHRQLRAKKRQINRAYDRWQRNASDSLLARFPRMRIKLGALRNRLMALFGW